MSDDFFDWGASYVPTCEHESVFADTVSSLSSKIAVFHALDNRLNEASDIQTFFGLLAHPSGDEKLLIEV
jgi:hypothetical protein